MLLKQQLTNVLGQSLSLRLPDIDYGVAEARTTYGVIGVKVWIFKGEIMSGTEIVEEEKAADTAPAAQPA